MKLDSLDEKIQLKKGDISTNNNLKEEIIEKEMPLFKNKIKTGNQNDLMKIKQNKENIKISQNIENESLNKEKDNKIYESITGSIIGTPRQKNIVEYGSTKGYKRPNIKKGKDFTHNPEILIEGTISGIKNIPPTLKSIFESKINDDIILNNNVLLKPSDYKISEFDIPEYLREKEDLNKKRRKFKNEKR